jgi:hypothetical protein
MGTRRSGGDLQCAETLCHRLSLEPRS